MKMKKKTTTLTNKKIFCPKCGSDDLFHITRTKKACNDCNGEIFEVKIDEEGNVSFVDNNNPA